MKKLSVYSKTKIFEIIMKLSFTAVVAELFYIIARLHNPMLTIEDAMFVHLAPEMLRYMLLATVIITAFSAAAVYIIKNEQS